MEALISQFIDRYLTRKEVTYRLPVRTPVDQFWPKLFGERKRRAVELPLKDQQGRNFWYVLNSSIERQADKVAETARRDIAFSGLLTAPDDGLIDEAVYSSVIEGAFTSKTEAAKLIRTGIAPRNRSEQMVENNYRALLFALEHLDDPVTGNMLISIVKILTRDASEESVDGYRDGPVFVTGKDGIVYTPPEADKIDSMMEALIDFINSYNIHPVLKACIAHFYLVYVHPFKDGNGRTARAISYMILLRSGYDQFRYFSISGMIAEERSRYYRSMVNVEDPENGGNDMTYFIDYYTSMLVRVVRKAEDHLRSHVIADRIRLSMEKARIYNERQIAGMEWLLQNAYDHVTVEQWKKKFGTATETARKDLLQLANNGLLERSIEGKKAVFALSGSQPALLELLR